MNADIAVLKERIRQLEIEKAVTESEKTRAVNGLQCIIGLIVTQHPTCEVGSGQHPHTLNKAGGKAILTSLPASLGSALSGTTLASAEWTTKHDHVEPEPTSDTSMGNVNRAQPQLLGQGCGPKPEVRWNTERPSIENEDFIDLSDEGYVSHFTPTNEFRGKLASGDLSVSRVEVR